MLLEILRPPAAPITIDAWDETLAVYTLLQLAERAKAERNESNSRALEESVSLLLSLLTLLSAERKVEEMERMLASLCELFPERVWLRSLAK